MLKYRVISGVSFLSVVAAMAVWAPTWVIALFIFLLAALAIHELVALLNAAGYPALKWTTLGVGLYGMLAVTLDGLDAPHGHHMLWLTPGVAAVAVFLGCLFRSDQTKTLEKIAGSFFALAYIPALMQYYLLILLQGDGPRHGDGRMLLVYGILVVKFTDIGAYFTGSALGRNKLIPRISPAKTWEGVLGGVALAVGISLLLMSLMGRRVGGVEFTWADAVALGVLLSVAGILGDLVESMLKRAADVKDSGTWIKGMGGLLDVLDSLLFGLPALHVYTIWVMGRGGPGL